MKRFLLSLVIVALHFSYSSAEPLDSLCERIGQCLDDVTRLDEGRQLLEQAFATDGVEHNRFYPQLLYLQSHYYTNTGDFARSKQHLLQLLSLLPADCNAELSISVPQELGLAYRREGKLDSAFHYYDQAIEEAWRQGDLEWQAAISANVGILHYNINHFAEAEQYLQQGLEYVRQVDDPYTELCLLQTCGAVKVALGKLQEAEPLLRQAYQMATEAESPDWQLRCLTTMMPMYDKMGFADSAQACRERGDVLLSQLPQQSITATGFITSRANHYYDNGKWQQAISDFETVVTHGGAAVKTATVFERMARCYARLARWEQAYCYMDSARIEADTLASERLTSQMAEFNSKYQTMEKDLQIARLQAQRLWMAIAAIVVILLLTGLTIFYRMRRQRREAQMRIATLEDERRRIARELHDGLCNDMLALELRMQGSANSHFSEQLNNLRQKARHLSHQLMPPEFNHLSIHQLLQQLTYTISQNTSLTVTYEAQPSADDVWRQLPSTVSHEIYRIAQEMTANLVKGGTATRLTVRLEQQAAGHYELTIVDDGRPLADAQPTTAQGLGNRTQQDRITSIGAHCRTWQQDGENHFLLEFSA